MINTLHFLILFIISVSFAHAFEPLYQDTQKFQVNVSSSWRGRSSPVYCRIETFFDQNKNAIQIRVGVVGSPVDSFGWNSSLELTDLPLKKGFEKVYKVAGNTTMILRYDGKTLTFDRDKKDQIWNRLYPYQLEIDPHLQNPKRFVARLEGYETNFLGLPKRHMSQSCEF